MTTIRRATPADLRMLPILERSAAQAFRRMDVPDDLFDDVSPVERWIPLEAEGTIWVDLAWKRAGR